MTAKRNLAAYANTKILQKVVGAAQAYIAMKPGAKTIELWAEDYDALNRRVKRLSDGKATIVDCEIDGRRVVRGAKRK